VGPFLRFWSRAGAHGFLGAAPRSCGAIRPAGPVLVHSYECFTSPDTGKSTNRPTVSNDTGTPGGPRGTGAWPEGSVCEERAREGGRERGRCAGRSRSDSSCRTSRIHRRTRHAQHRVQPTPSTPSTLTCSPLCAPPNHRRIDRRTNCHNDSCTDSPTDSRTDTALSPRGRRTPDAGPQPPTSFAPAARAELLSHASARERGRRRAARAAGVVRVRWSLRFLGYVRFFRCLRGQSVRAASGGCARPAVAASATLGRPGFRRRSRWRSRRGWSLAVGQSVERPAARPLHRWAFR
jgi:hypothetical protein